MTSVLLVEADELSGVFGKISIELGVSCAVLSGDMGEWERNKAETVFLHGSAAVTQRLNVRRRK